MKLKNLAAIVMAGMIGISAHAASSNSAQQKNADAIHELFKELDERYEKKKQEKFECLKSEKKNFDRLHFVEIPLVYHDDLNTSPYWYWKEYSGTNGKKEPRMKLDVIDDPLGNYGIRIDYCTPKKSHNGMFHTYFYELLDLDESEPEKWDTKRGLDVSCFDGIELKVRGNGKIRLQLTEGHENGFETHFGEIHGVIITPVSKFKTYRFPFKKFAKRKDFQHSEGEFAQQGLGECCLMDYRKFDNNLDLSDIHSTEIEFLQKGLFEKERYVEIKYMGFYKD